MANREKGDRVLKKIEDKGCRYSLARESILSLIIKSHKPLSCFDIQKFLAKKKLLANKTTIYRQLAFLRAQKIIKELQFNDGIRYYEVTPKGHHHHIVCTRCETIDHVELKKDLDTQEKIIFRNNRFKVLTHWLEFYGICDSCIKSKS